MKNSSLRFSLATLMMAVLFIGLACAALRYASELWASVSFTLAVGVFLAGSLGVVFRRERPRTFCLGFVLFGGGYLFVVFGPWFRGNSGPQPPALLTTKLLGYLHPKLSETVTLPGSGSGANMISVQLFNAETIYSGPRTVVVPSWEHFQQVGHSLLALIIALVGGVLARYFYATRREPDEGAAGPLP